MLDDLLKTFTDRDEAIALFDELRHSKFHRSAWPLLPILSFIAPGGSGKSTLIEYLITSRCCKDNKAILPYAYIDFTAKPAVELRDLLRILIELRDQLHTHTDGLGKRITFPRFDLAASIARQCPVGSHLPEPDEDAIRKSLQGALPTFRFLNEMGNALNSAFPFISPILTALKWAEKLAWKIEPLDKLLLLLEYEYDWQWYRTADAELGLNANVSLRDVLIRLHDLSVSSRPEKEGSDHIENHVLPAAFIADLHAALDGSDTPRTWNSSTNIVLFLDGFEVLLQSARSAAIQLLKTLACNQHRKRGETDPLLVVIGSRQRLLEERLSPEKQLAQNPSFEVQTRINDNQLTQEDAMMRFAHWQQLLPKNTRYLDLEDLYLPLWLHDFGLEDTRTYLHKIEIEEQVALFTDESLIQAIHHATDGHPLYLALACAAALKADAQGRVITPDKFENAPVIQFRNVAPGHFDEIIGDYLLKLLLRELTSGQRKELISYAVPRFPDVDTLRVLLKLETNDDVKERLNEYRNFTFLRVTNEGYVELHAVLRKLLLKRMPPSREAASRYQKTHQILRNHFHHRAKRGDERALIEEVYHALALGDPNPAEKLAIFAQSGNFPLWIPLMEAVAQAPTDLMPVNIEQRANDASKVANRYYRPKEAATALVLYQWLKSTLDERSEKWADVQRQIGLTYCDLRGSDQQKNIERAIDCFNLALKVYDRDEFLEKRITALIDLGEAYTLLRGKDRNTTRKSAISCYEQALKLCTVSTFPFPKEWARIQNNFGEAYSDIPGTEDDLTEEDQQSNLLKAIAYYEQALTVRTHDAFPFDWAITMNNLGNAYSHLPQGNRQKHVVKAIDCYNQALSFHKKEDYPVEWARAQNNLGNAYSHMPGSKQDRKKHLDRAISHYTAALEERTYEDLPFDWAITMRNLGNALSHLLEDNPQTRQRNILQAIACYKQALKVFRRETFPIDWAKTHNALGNAYRNLKLRIELLNQIEARLLSFDREVESSILPLIAVKGKYNQTPRENILAAIDCHNQALGIFTRKHFKLEWATTEHNLGLAFSNLQEQKEEDRQANLEDAAAHYENALQVRTKKDYPEECAATQKALGNAYSRFPLGDLHTHLLKAQSCYAEARDIYIQLQRDDDVLSMENELKTVQNRLDRLGN